MMAHQIRRSSSYLRITSSPSTPPSRHLHLNASNPTSIKQASSTISASHQNPSFHVSNALTPSTNPCVIEPNRKTHGSGGHILRPGSTYADTRMDRIYTREQVDLNVKFMPWCHSAHSNLFSILLESHSVFTGAEVVEFTTNSQNPLQAGARAAAERQWEQL